MRMIGGSDYYDSARAFGEDDDVVYIRKSYDTAEIISLPVVEFKAPRIRGPQHAKGASSDPGEFTRYKKLSLTHVPVDVIFAGRRFWGVMTIVAEIDKQPQTVVHWWREAFEQYIRQYDLVPVFSTWDQKRTIEQYRNQWGMTELSNVEQQYLIENGIAIAIAQHNLQDRKKQTQWKVNCDGLRIRQFAKAVDPYQAYQELAMYVGGVLPRQPNSTVQLEGEKIMVAKHGFHNKYAFRKQPTEKST